MNLTLIPSRVEKIKIQKMSAFKHCLFPLRKDLLWFKSYVSKTSNDGTQIQARPNILMRGFLFGKLKLDGSRKPERLFLRERFLDCKVHYIFLQFLNLVLSEFDVHFMTSIILHHSQLAEMVFNFGFNLVPFLIFITLYTVSLRMTNLAGVSSDKL